MEYDQKQRYIVRYTTQYVKQKEEFHFMSFLRAEIFQERIQDKIRLICIISIYILSAECTNN